MCVHNIIIDLIVHVCAQCSPPSRVVNVDGAKTGLARTGTELKHTLTAAQLPHLHHLQQEKQMCKKMYWKHD